MSQRRECHNYSADGSDKAKGLRLITKITEQESWQRVVHEHICGGHGMLGVSQWGRVIGEFLIWRMSNTWAEG